MKAKKNLFCFVIVMILLQAIPLNAKNFIDVKKIDNKYFMEVPKETIGRDILVTITITKGAYRKERKNDMRFGYAGDSMFDKMIRLTTDGYGLFITYPQIYYKDSTAIDAAYLAKQMDPIAYSLPVVSKTDTSFVADITDLLMSDCQLFSLSGAADQLKISGYQQQYTDIKEVNCYPENINFLSLRSYNLSQPEKDEHPSSQWEVSSSWYLLPEKPMQPRLADNRVGYFVYPLVNTPNAWSSARGLGSVAARWRLEPKEADVEKYLRGELVEPKKPIVFYISRSVPEYLRPYFIKAVNRWQEAFEYAGFKNAIHAEMVPDDASYNEGDVRYPLVSYKASPIPNAYGPMVVDPRSGEIITSHIGIYHSVLDLIQRWYFVMCSQVDERAREYPLSKDIVGSLVETVLAHEVGHTLGLRHDFMGSTAYPVDSLRSNSFISKNGLGVSIMDYQRFNYIAQPGDKIEPENLLPRIGDYDRFAIKWGYKYMPNSSMTQVQKTLRDWVTDVRKKDKRMIYLEERTHGDPRVQSEDSGDDDIVANEYGMKNLQYIMDHIEDWTQTDDKDYYPLRRRYLSVINQYWNYIGHVVNYIGGMYKDNPDINENLNLNTKVPKAQQLKALEFINKYMIKEQTWLWRKDLMEKTGINWSYDIDQASMKLGVTLLKYTIAKRNPSDEDISMDDIFKYIYNNVYLEKTKYKTLSVHDRMLQKNLLTDITVNAENVTNLGTGAALKLKDLLNKIKKLCDETASKETDSITKSHYQTMSRFVTIWQTGDNKALKN